MGIQLLGLLCLLFGMAAFFCLWSLTIKNRSKTIEADMAHTEPVAHPQRMLRDKGYSLSPREQKHATRTHEQVMAPSPASTTGQANTARPPLPCTAPELAQDQTGPVDDPMARTHLEIANQFFGMGDFEGAVEMCQLVIDNPDASEIQITDAKQLKLECA